MTTDARLRRLERDADPTSAAGVAALATGLLRAGRPREALEALRRGPPPTDEAREVAQAAAPALARTLQRLAPAVVLQASRELRHGLLAVGGAPEHVALTIDHPGAWDPARVALHHATTGALVREVPLEVHPLEAAFSRRACFVLDDRFGLFEVPLDRRRAPVRSVGPLLEPDMGPRLAVTADGRRVVVSVLQEAILEENLNAFFAPEVFFGGQRPDWTGVFAWPSGERLWWKTGRLQALDADHGHALVLVEPVEGEVVDDDEDGDGPEDRSYLLDLTGDEVRPLDVGDCHRCAWTGPAGPLVRRDPPGAGLWLVPSRLAPEVRHPACPEVGVAVEDGELLVLGPGGATDRLGRPADWCRWLADGRTLLVGRTVGAEDRVELWRA